MNYKNILVPYDFSQDSKEALKTAVDYFNHQKDVTITLLHVIEDMPADLDEGDSTFDSHDIDKMTTRLEAEASQYEQRCHIKLKVEIGKADHKILETAGTDQSHLIIMGAHGKSPLSQKLFGATTYNVSRKAECSTMQIKSAD